MKEQIKFTLNGKPIELNLDSDRMLLWILRTDLGLTGTKYGCGESYCGACTVLIDKKPVLSCLTLAVAAQGKSVITIEGLAHKDKLDSVQKAFIEEGAIQCGFCTPGMILSAKALLESNPKPSIDDIKEAISGNLCRCTGYAKIVKAMEKASQ